MTTSDPRPFLTREWRTTPDIARDVWESEGRRGDFHCARNRVLQALKRMESTGEAERMDSVLPSRWRLKG